MKIFIDRIIFPVLSLGPGKRAVIWTTGCIHRCLGCSNPELWEHNENKIIEIKMILEVLSKISGNGLDGVTITGGDPCYQFIPLLELIKRIHSEITDDILVYTGYEIEELKSQYENDFETLEKNIAVLIDGKYIEEKNDDYPLRGSSNQRIHILNSNYEEVYNNYLIGHRKAQNIIYENKLITVGIPQKNYRKYMREMLEGMDISIEYY